jgi:hypothetical protein
LCFAVPKCFSYGYFKCSEYNYNGVRFYITDLGEERCYMPENTVNFQRKFVFIALLYELKVWIFVTVVVVMVGFLTLLANFQEMNGSVRIIYLNMYSP